MNGVADRATDLPTMLANLRRELTSCEDRLLARWSGLLGLEATLPPVQHGAAPDGLLTRRLAELATRTGEDHELSRRILGQLHWACRVDAGETGAPSLVTENLRAAIGHVASMSSCLQAAAHTLRTAGPPRSSGLGEAVSMCRRFLGSAQHDLRMAGAEVDRAAQLVPEPSTRWHLRAVI